MLLKDVYALIGSMLENNPELSDYVVNDWYTGYPITGVTLDTDDNSLTISVDDTPCCDEIQFTLTNMSK